MGMAVPNNSKIIITSPARRIPITAPMSPVKAINTTAGAGGTQSSIQRSPVVNEKVRLPCPRQYTAPLRMPGPSRPTETKPRVRKLIGCIQNRHEPLGTVQFAQPRDTNAPKPATSVLRLRMPATSSSATFARTFQMQERQSNVQQVSLGNKRLTLLPMAQAVRSAGAHGHSAMKVTSASASISTCTTSAVSGSFPQHSGSNTLGVTPSCVNGLGRNILENTSSEATPIASTTVSSSHPTHAQLPNKSNVPNNSLLSMNLKDLGPNCKSFTKIKTSPMRHPVSSSAVVLQQPWGKLKRIVAENRVISRGLSPGLSKLDRFDPNTPPCASALQTSLEKVLNMTSFSSYLDEEDRRHLTNRKQKKSSDLKKSEIWLSIETQSSPIVTNSQQAPESKPKNDANSVHRPPLSPVLWTTRSEVNKIVDKLESTSAVSSTAAQKATDQEKNLAKEAVDTDGGKDEKTTDKSMSPKSTVVEEILDKLMRVNLANPDENKNYNNNNSDTEEATKQLERCYKEMLRLWEKYLSWSPNTMRTFEVRNAEFYGYTADACTMVSDPELSVWKEVESLAQPVDLCSVDFFREDSSRANWDFSQTNMLLPAVLIILLNFWVFLEKIPFLMKKERTIFIVSMSPVSNAVLFDFCVPNRQVPFLLRLSLIPWVHILIVVASFGQLKAQITEIWAERSS